MATNGQSTRFGDTPLAFSMTRWSSGESDPRVMWRFGVSRYCGRPLLIEIDADLSTLVEMRNYIDAAIKLVRTDGGRVSDEAPQ